MRLRRCAVAWLEPREVATFQLDDLLSGGTGVVRPQNSPNTSKGASTKIRS